MNYPETWPKCPSCGEPAMDGHITCGKFECNESGARRARAECVCEKEHHLPAWRCPVHGDVVVPMD